MKTRFIFLLLMAFVSLQSYAKDPGLKEAIMTQDVVKTKELLNSGADPNEMISGSPVIRLAATFGNVEIIKLLVEKGAIVDKVGTLGLTALSGLAEGEKEPEELLARNKEINAKLIKRVKGDTAKVAKWISHEDITRFSTVNDRIKCLIELGADPNYVLGSGAVKIGTPFLWAVKAGKLDIVKLMIETKKVDLEYRFDSYAEKSIRVSNKLGAGRLGDAATEKEWAEISMFNTPLLYAIDKENLELVKVLIEGGADINNGKKIEWDESSPEYRIHHWELWTPLDVATKAKKPNQEIIEYLKSKGALTNAK